MSSLAVASLSSRIWTGRPVPSASALTSGAALRVRLTIVGGGGGGGGGGGAGGGSSEPNRPQAESAEQARSAVASRRERVIAACLQKVRDSAGQCRRQRRAGTAARPRAPGPGSAP